MNNGATYDQESEQRSGVASTRTRIAGRHAMFPRAWGILLCFVGVWFALSGPVALLVVRSRASSLGMVLDTLVPSLLGILLVGAGVALWRQSAPAKVWLISVLAWIGVTLLIALERGDVILAIGFAVCPLVLALPPLHYLRKQGATAIR